MNVNIHQNPIQQSTTKLQTKINILTKMKYIRALFAHTSQSGLGNENIQAKV